MLENTEFYPTPKSLLDQTMAGFDWTLIETVLEPEAGKGDIADFIKERANLRRYNNDIEIDCIEIDSELRATLKGKGYRIIHDDFLTFNTFKRYNLIAMNPPFSAGAKHLLKALDMQKNGGNIFCILNAETIKNPYSNERKDLLTRLNELETDISFIEEAFISAERKTSVEVAVIKVVIPDVQKKSFIYEELKQKAYAENVEQDVTDVSVNDYIKAIVAQYNIELESGVRLIQEYRAMEPYILNSFQKENPYNKPLLEMKVGDKELSVNRYVERVRNKYWSALFNNDKFTKNMTSNLISNYHSQVSELSNYDFTVYNIKSIQFEMSKNLISGIEDCIITLFDELTAKYSWYKECEKNIHYYSGWATNKAWIINKKVILPYMNAFDSLNGRFNPTYTIMQKLSDIEKALNYLDGGLTESRNLRVWLDNAKQTGQTKKIPLKYFNVTFYKKGTCHIEFSNLELLKKLNIFGSQKKGWLPPSYCKKKYYDMTPEEKIVIDEFEGEKSYQETIQNAKYYLFDSNSFTMLEDKSA